MTGMQRISRPLNDMLDQAFRDSVARLDGQYRAGMITAEEYALKLKHMVEAAS